MLYKVMDVYVNRSTGFFVGDRAMVLKDGSLYDKTEYDPIHVNDLARMTKDYLLDKNQALRCNLTRLVDNSTETSIDLQQEISIIENGATELHIDDYNRFYNMRYRGDSLVAFCLLTQSGQTGIFTPLTRKQERTMATCGTEGNRLN